MTDLHEAIRQRRSIRKLQPQPVPQKLILEALEAASWAPSAHNSQPWRFIILQDAQARASLGAGLENLLLAAYAAGLGT